MHPFMAQPIADRHTMQSGPYHTLRHTQTLCSVYLSFVFKTFVSTLKNKEVFPQELRLKFLSSHHFTSLRLHTFVPLLYLVLPTPFALSHRTEPPSCTTSHSLILHQETISLLQNRTPQNHIGFTLRSPIFTDLCRILGTSTFMRIKGIIHRVLFHIINCGNENIILGTPWLEVNPQINWTERTVDIPDHTDRTPDYN